MTRLLLFSGSTRVASTNGIALRTIAALAPDGVETSYYDHIADLPAFTVDGDDGAPHPAVATLRSALAAADVVLFCTPEYAGTLPGSFKNALDWTVGPGDLYERPVAWINVAAANRGLGASATLATVLGYVGAIVIEAACRHIPLGREMLGPDGLVADPGTREQFEQAIAAIVEFGRASR